MEEKLLQGIGEIGKNRRIPQKWTWKRFPVLVWNKENRGRNTERRGIKINATVIPEPLGPTEGPPVDELFGPLGFAALHSFLFLLSVTIKAEEQIRLKRQSLEQRK